MNITKASGWLHEFNLKHGASTQVYRAPGRVNLIGEHTDYNDGFVMPAAIEFYTWIAVTPREDRRLVVHSTNFPDSIKVDLEAGEPRPRSHWTDYVVGVAVMLERVGHCLRGANLLVHGEVPIGAGLSSSAAIEVAAGLALLGVSSFSMQPLDLAKLCQRAENEFVGARCGIMDQFISCCGRAGHALLLDCRTLDYRMLPLPEEISLVICNTMVRHKIASGEYNARRAECEEGVLRLSRFLPHVRALRDVSFSDLERYAGSLPETIYKRCRHVVTENQRVTDAARSLERGDLFEFGNLMRASHLSLRDDFQVSCAELDLMVDFAEKLDGVFGARMTGGGFGGCTINLVRTETVPEFQRKVASAYEKATGLVPQIIVTPAAAGAGEVQK
jgi:galactokinase